MHPASTCLLGAQQSSEPCCLCLCESQAHIVDSTAPGHGALWESTIIEGCERLSLGIKGEGEAGRDGTGC